MPSPEGSSCVSDAAAKTVTATLRKRIIAAQYAAGTPLREVALAKEFELSRVPVREALRILTAEGFVDTRANVGSRVAHPPFDDARELFDLRITLETSLVRDAAARFAEFSAPGAAHVERSRRLCTEIEDALAQGDEAFANRDGAGIAEANLRVHQGLGDLAMRPVLSHILQQIGGRVEWLHSAHRGFTATRDTSAWDQHKIIYDLVRAGDVRSAHTHMRSHLEASRDAFVASLSSLADEDR